MLQQATGQAHCALADAEERHSIWHLYFPDGSCRCTDVTLEPHAHLPRPWFEGLVLGVVILHGVAGWWVGWSIGWLVVSGGISECVLTTVIDLISLKRILAVPMPDISCPMLRVEASVAILGKPDFAINDVSQGLIIDIYRRIIVHRGGPWLLILNVKRILLDVHNRSIFDWEPLAIYNNILWNVYDATPMAPPREDPFPSPSTEWRPAANLAF